MSLRGHEPAKRVDLLITHLHTDHIEGLRFFAPFWDPDVEFRVWGPPAPVKGLEQRLAPFFAPPYFPVHLRNVPSRPRFLEVPDEPWTIGSMTVSAALVKHPGARGRVPDRRRRANDRVPPRPRAGPRHRPRERRGDVDLRPGDRAQRRPADPRRAVHERRVRRARRMGSLEHDRRRDVRRPSGSRPPGAVPPRSPAHRRRPRGDARRRRRLGASVDRRARPRGAVVRARTR